MKKITKIDANQVVKAETKVAAYARVSTSSDEQLASLASQKKHYENYIKAHKGWHFAGIYFDEGISGTKIDKRNGLRSLIADCAMGKVDLIITKSISRFSRNTVDSIEIVRELLSRGIHIYFEKENINTGSMESELLLSILSSLAESESRSISENMKWGIRKRFMDGTFKQGCIPYGYTSEDGAFVIKPDEAEVVKRIFESFVSGMSMSSIAETLNKESIKAPRNEKWGDWTINGILNNEKYIGAALYQKRYTDEQFNVHKNHGELNQYYIRDHHEAIISEELFNLASEVRNRNCHEKGIEQGGNKYNQRYPFSGKIICDQCGNKWKRVKIGEAFSYACTGHLKDKSSCSLKTIREAAVQTAFTTMMNKLIFANKIILIPFLEQARTFENKQAYERLVEIEEELTRLTERRSRIVKLFAKSFLDPSSFAEENDAIGKQEESLKKEQKDIENNIMYKGTRLEAIGDLIVFCNTSSMLDSFDGNLFERFVDSIMVYSREEIGFVMKCGPIFKERINI